MKENDDIRLLGPTQYDKWITLGNSILSQDCWRYKMSRKEVVQTLHAPLISIIDPIEECSWMEKHPPMNA